MQNKGGIRTIITKNRPFSIKNRNGHIKWEFFNTHSYFLFERLCITIPSESKFIVPFQIDFVTYIIFKLKNNIRL